MWQTDGRTEPRTTNRPTCVMPTNSRPTHLPGCRLNHKDVLIGRTHEETQRALFSLLPPSRTGHKNKPRQMHYGAFVSVCFYVRPSVRLSVWLWAKFFKTLWTMHFLCLSVFVCFHVCVFVCRFLLFYPDSNKLIDWLIKFLARKRLI